MAYVDATPAGPPRGYGQRGLRRADLATTWWAQLAGWFTEAAAHPQLVEPGAMVLATADAAANPSVRTVLCKGFDESGVRFFTNLGSRKALDLAANPVAAAVFSWVALERQVILTGPVVRLPAAEVSAYARSRPRGSQLSAWASRQSVPIAGREELERARAAVERRFAGTGEVPVPDFWGGYRLLPSSVEFWQGRSDRLHDRLRYQAQPDGGWQVQRLQP